MKVQYFSDVNDYRKFALLKALSGKGFTIGVCWMLTEAEGSCQGDNRSYLRQPDKWRGYDPALFDALALAPATPTIEDFCGRERSPNSQCDLLQRVHVGWASRARSVSPGLHERL